MRICLVTKLTEIKRVLLGFGALMLLDFAEMFGSSLPALTRGSQVMMSSHIEQGWVNSRSAMPEWTVRFHEVVSPCAYLHQTLVHRRALRLHLFVTE